MDVLEEKMLEKLNLFKLENNWVQRVKLKKGEFLSKEDVLKNIIWVEKGILHSELKIKEKFQVFTLIKSNEIIYPSSVEYEKNNWRIVADIPSKIILINKEYFLNYATVEPVYMEWLLDKANDNFHKASNELTKYARGLEVQETIEQILEIMEKEGVSKEELLHYFSKKKLASYTQVTRGTFYTSWKKLEDNGFFRKVHY